VDEVGVEIVLVGDSLAQTMLGYENTLSVTMDEMLHHVKAVRRGVKNALLVATCPTVRIRLILKPPRQRRPLCEGKRRPDGEVEGGKSAPS